MGFYLLFPFLINDLRSTWAWKLILSLLAAMPLIAVCSFFDLRPFDAGHIGLTSTGLLYTNPIARLFEFTLGMSAAVLWNSYRDRIGQTSQHRSYLGQVLSADGPLRGQTAGRKHLTIGEACGFSIGSD